MHELSTNGMLVFVNIVEYHSQVFLLIAGGDVPGASELSGHTGHSSLYGCRICKQLVSHEDNRNNLYIPFKDANSKIIAKYPLRTLKEF